MKGFKDLDFTFRGILQARLDFDNGYGVSVITGAGSYGDQEKPYEMAIMKNGSLCYSTWITSGVLGYLNESEVTKYMEQVQQLENEPALLADVFVEGERVMAKYDHDEWEEVTYLATINNDEYKYIVSYDESERLAGNTFEAGGYKQIKKIIKKMPKTLNGTTRTIEGNEYLLTLVTND